MSFENPIQQLQFLVERNKRDIAERLSDNVTLNSRLSDNEQDILALRKGIEQYEGAIKLLEGAFDKK